MTNSTQPTAAGTAPVFPPGRYGRRRSPRRTPRWLPILAAIAVLAAALGIAVRLYRQYANPPYEANVMSVTETTEDHVTLEFSVTVPPGGAASCRVLALASSGREVGQAIIEVRAAPGATRATTVYRLATTARPRVVDVPGCGPAR